MNPASPVSGPAENAREFARTAKLAVTAGDAGERLDRFLAAQLPELSRTRIQSLVDHGRVSVNGAPGKRSYRVASGDAVVLDIPAPSAAAAQPE
ncbi:MAG: S4 domain-containing protein, partial [Candidatus Acidiferrales bacterium]